MAESKYIQLICPVSDANKCVLKFDWQTISFDKRGLEPYLDSKAPGKKIHTFLDAANNTVRPLIHEIKSLHRVLWISTVFVISAVIVAVVIGLLGLRHTKVISPVLAFSSAALELLMAIAISKKVRGLYLAGRTGLIALIDRTNKDSTLCMKIGKIDFEWLELHLKPNRSDEVKLIAQIQSVDENSTDSKMNINSFGVNQTVRSLNKTRSMKQDETSLLFGTQPTPERPTKRKASEQEFLMQDHSSRQGPVRPFLATSIS